MSKEAMGRLVLEASAGQHGAVAAKLAAEWTAMAQRAADLQAQIDATPRKSFVNMGAQALAAELAEAVSKDEEEEGLDISAGLYGTHTSAWLRHVAAEYLANPPAPRPCKGLPRAGCGYLSPCGSICNKCGHVHEVPQAAADLSARLDAHTLPPEPEPKEMTAREADSWRHTTWGL